MSTATLIKLDRKWPVTPKKRYRFLIEWAASGTSDALTVAVRWFDSSDSAVDTWTIYSGTATTANTWQVNAAHLVPPETARYARIRISKPAVATKFAIQRVEFKEHDSSLERAFRQIVQVDDFDSTSIGRLPWARYDISGHVVTTKVTATGAFGNWSEFGITRLTTGVTTGYGGVIHLERLGKGLPPIGTENRWKVRMQDTTNVVCWMGLWSDLTTYPDEATANTISGIGFRLEAAGAGENWFGVVRNGTSETTQDMGVSADTTWRDLGWYMTDAGVQFTLNGVAVGTEKTSNLPGSSDILAPIFGLLTATSAAKEADIDLYGLQLYLDRV